jgi:hypothetical protein
MNLEHFSAKWFTIYYAVVGFLLVGSGIYLNLKENRAVTFLLDAANHEKPPPLLIKIVRYFLLFTLPGLVLSFFPFSWIELLFTLWSLLLVYLAGIQLVRWDQTRKLIKARNEKLPVAIQRCGAIMVAVGFAIFLIAYLVIVF